MLKRKVWIASLLCTALLATGCSAAGTQTESVNSGELSTESESESGPVTKSITVVSITGNQLTYRVNEEETGEAPSGEMPSGEKPSGGRMEKQNGTDAGTFAGFSKGNRGSMEVKTIYLPVSVKVTTDTGKTKTYQILQAGDVLDVTFDTDSAGNEVITAITMTGTSNS